MSEAKAAEEKQKQEEEEKEDEKPKFEQSDKHITQKENVHEYFKRKMAERMARLSAPAGTFHFYRDNIFGHCHLYCSF